MSKVKYFFSILRIEEYILLLFSLIFFIVYFSFYPIKAWAEPFKVGLMNVIFGLGYFSSVFYFFYLYPFYRLYLFLGERINKAIDKKQLSSRVKFNDARHRYIIFTGIKKWLEIISPTIRLLLIISIFFQITTMLLGAFGISLSGRLVDGLLMKADKSLFGLYPFIEFQNNNFLKVLEPFLVYSFYALGLVMGIVLVIFYLTKDRKFFSQYILAIIIALSIAFPIWYLFPANSPQNTYLNNVYSKTIDGHISETLKNYQPTNFVSRVQNKLGVQPGEIAPVSTMPSMHVAWATIIVYLTYKFKKKLIFIFLPWAVSSSLGAVYLAQHYFVDFLVSLPLAAISIILAISLTGLEKKYYQGITQDKKEQIFKNQIKKDLKIGYLAIKENFPMAPQLIRSLIKPKMTKTNN